MKNTTILTIVTVIVTVILTTSVLVPVIEEAQNVGVKKTVTFTNEGESLIEGNVSDTYDMQWDNALPGTIKINNPSPTVYFVAGTGATVSPESKTVVKDLTYGDLPVPVKYGYSFDGWFSDEQYTTQIVSTDIVESTGNIFLYAKWTAGQYTVTFDADGGSVSPSTKTVTFGSAYGELPVPEYTGHIFGGWVDANDNPTTSQTIVSIGENHTLTAVWTLDQYLISFTTDGHGTVDVPSVTVDFGTAYTISDNTITIGSTTVTATPSSGYVWSHWTPVNVSGTVGGAMTFIANFDLPSITITFTAQSPGSVSTASIEGVSAGTSYTVSDNIVTISGYTPVTASLPDGYYFIGWSIPQGAGTITESMTFSASYEPIKISKITGNQTIFVLTTDGKIFGSGYNYDGQLGTGNTTNSTSFIQLMSDKEVADVVCTVNTTWAITSDGKLYGCGDGASGKQGSGTTSDVLTFTQRLENETIVKVSGSDSTTWAITTDGKLFGCGANNYGQQGIQYDSTNITTFTQRLSEETISDVVASSSCTWVITTDGKLFGCGRNNYGQQGSGDTTDVMAFTQRLVGNTVTKVMCSGSTTWALTSNGKLFGCGDNSSCQQGMVGGSGSMVLTFTQRLENENIKDFFESGSTTWAVTSSGKLYGCGSNSYNQQGVRGSSGSAISAFQQRLSGESVTKVVCSTQTTWALTTQGEIFGCGRNNYGQQGSGNTTDVASFTQRLSDKHIADIICSTSCTRVLTTDGELFGCGRNNYGQQASGDTTNVSSFTQRTPSGYVHITPVNTLQIHSLSIPRALPLASPIVRSIQTPQISDTSYTYLAGGSNWMLCSMVTDQNENALVLYSEDLAEPLVWTDDLVILTFSNGVMAVEKDGTDYEISYTSIFFKGNGKYVLLNDTAYVTENTPILGYAMTDDGMIGASGTMNSMTPFTMSGVTLGDATAITEESEYEDVYLLSGVDIGYGSDSTTSCTSIILPKSVNAIVTVEDTTLPPLLWVIPVLILAGIVLFIVRSMMNRYD